MSKFADALDDLQTKCILGALILHQLGAVYLLEPVHHPFGYGQGEHGVIRKKIPLGDQRSGTLLEPPEFVPGAGNIADDGA